MARYRQIHVKIWKDGWFLDLPPKRKLFFIYLFSNERASIAGIYELPIAVMAFESGLSRDGIVEAFDEFSAAGKAYYEDGVVWVANLRDYHETSSAQLQKGIQNEIDEVKDCALKRRYLECYGENDEEPEPEAHNEEGLSEPPFEGNGHGGEGIERVYRPSIMSKSTLKSKSGDRGSGKGGESARAAWTLVRDRLCDGNEERAGKIFAFEKQFYEQAGWLRPDIDSQFDRRKAAKECWRPLKFILEQVSWQTDSAVQVAGNALQEMRDDGLTPARPSGLIGQISKNTADTIPTIGDDTDDFKIFNPPEEAQSG